MAGELDQAVRPVLLVKDDAAYRSALSGALRTAGLDPVEAATCLEALDIIEGEPGISLAVVGSYTPPHTLNALAFARMMKRKNRTARVVLMLHDPHDIDALDEGEAEIFAGIVLKLPDTVQTAAGILDSFGFRK